MLQDVMQATTGKPPTPNITPNTPIVTPNIKLKDADVSPSARKSGMEPRVEFPNISSSKGIKGLVWDESGEDTAPLSVPQDEWDKLKYRASVVLEENQVSKRSELRVFL